MIYANGILEDLKSVISRPDNFLLCTEAQQNRIGVHLKKCSHTYIDTICPGKHVDFVSSPPFFFHVSVHNFKSECNQVYNGKLYYPILALPTFNSFRSLFLYLLKQNLFIYEFLYFYLLFIYEFMEQYLLSRILMFSFLLDSIY